MIEEALERLEKSYERRVVVDVDEPRYPVASLFSSRMGGILLLLLLSMGIWWLGLQRMMRRVAWPMGMNGFF